MLQENIKIARKARGLSQQQLADRLHVVRQTVSKWEQGLSVPDADLLLGISQVLETPVSALLEQTAEDAPAPKTEQTPAAIPVPKAVLAPETGSTSEAVPTPETGQTPKASQTPDIDRPAGEDLQSISQKLEAINLQLAQRKIRRRRILHVAFIVLFVGLAVAFIALGKWGSPYLGWDQSEPELLVGGVFAHVGEWLFVRAAPFLLPAALLGAILTRKRG